MRAAAELMQQAAGRWRRAVREREKVPTSLHSLTLHSGHGWLLHGSVTSRWNSLHSRSTSRRPRLFMQYDSLLRLPRPHVLEHCGGRGRGRVGVGLSLIQHQALACFFSELKKTFE